MSLMSCHVNVTWDPSLGMNTHQLWEASATIAAFGVPTPNAPVPALEMIATQWWPTGYAMGANSFCEGVKHHDTDVVGDGHDLGMLVPDITYPPTNLWFPLQWLFSSREMAFSASTVEFGGLSPACSQLFPPLPMMTCGDPMTLPTSFPIINMATNELKVGMNLTDILAGLAGIAISMALDAIMEWGAPALKKKVRGPAKEAARKAAKEASEKAAKEAAQEAVQKAGREAGEKAAREVKEKAAKEASEKRIKEAVEDHARDEARDAARKAAREAAEEAAEKAAKEAREEAAEEAAEAAAREAREEALERARREAQDRAQREAAEDAQRRAAREAADRAAREAAEEAASQAAAEASEKAQKQARKNIAMKNVRREWREEVISVDFKSKDGGRGGARGTGLTPASLAKNALGGLSGLGRTAVQGDPAYEFAVGGGPLPSGGFQVGGDPDHPLHTQIGSAPLHLHGGNFPGAFAL